MIPIREFVEGTYLLMATKGGIIKKTDIMEYSSARKSGLQAINLKDDDELIDVRLTDGKTNVVMVTHEGICITFAESDVRAVGRVSQGVIGIRLDEGDYVIGMEPIYDEKDCLLAITENGFGKRTELSEYRVQTRAGKGVITYKVTPKTGKVVGIKVVKEDDEVMLITDTGVLIRISVKDISILGRSTQGVTLMRSNDGGVVSSIAKITNDDSDEEE
jgi:DNA gyrase subunit A